MREDRIPIGRLLGNFRRNIADFEGSCFLFKGASMTSEQTEEFQKKVKHSITMIGI